MKKVYNYTFKLVCLYILVLSLFSIVHFEITVDHHSNIYNDNQNKAVDSTLLAQNQQVEDDFKEESITQSEKSENSLEENKRENIESEFTTKVEEVVNVVDTSQYSVLSEEIVNVSHYGHDCYGCTSGLTASGYYVGDGRIYYQDATFGSVRIVAADSKYPLGTILRIRYKETATLAIVLDRGSGIGDGKKFQIDLLVKSEAESYQLGILKNATLEVLRLGY